MNKPPRIEDERLPNSPELLRLSRDWLLESVRTKYSYRFTWMGRPIIQYPQDLVAMQELVWRLRPDAIVECGIAHGGSLVYYASLLELVGGDAKVVGVDIDIRAHNRAAIEAHPMMKRIELIEGSSIDGAIVARVHEAVRGRQRVLVVLDSNHTHDHVLGELRAYAPLVRAGGYVVVFDTLVEDLPDELIVDRPWKRGNSPKSAVHAYLQECDRFEIDRELEERLIITAAPSGYLRCVR